MPFRRRSVSWKTKLIAALRSMGLTLDDVHFDHDPCWALRPWNEETGDTDPPSDDPDGIVMLLRTEHKVKTYGTPTKATRRDSDIGTIAHVRRARKAEETFRARLLAKEAGRPPARPRSRLKGRGFPKRRKP